MREFSPGGDWLAIDDRPRYFRTDCSNLFVVPGVYEDEGGGITQAVAARLTARLVEFLAGRTDVCSPVSSEPETEPSSHRGS